MLYGVVLYGVVLYGVVLYGVVLYGVVLYGVVLYIHYILLYTLCTLVSHSCCAYIYIQTDTQL